MFKLLVVRFSSLCLCLLWILLQNITVEMFHACYIAFMPPVVEQSHSTDYLSIQVWTIFKHWTLAWWKFSNKFYVYLHIRLEIEYIIFAYNRQILLTIVRHSRCFLIYLSKGVFSLSEVTSPLQHQRSQRADVSTSEQADELTGITAMPCRGWIMGWCCGGGRMPCWGNISLRCAGWHGEPDLEWKTDH